MSKYVKDMITHDIRRRLDGVSDALLVSVSGMNAAKDFLLRKELRGKHVELMVVKNSLARRAAEGTPLAPAFQQLEGSLALVWGGEDIVSLAKLITKLSEDKQYAPFGNRGGVMDGSRLTADQVRDVSKWPSRGEQLSLLSGQILARARLASQLTAAGAALASQIKQRGEEEEVAGDQSAAEPTPS